MANLEQTESLRARLSSAQRDLAWAGNYNFRVTLIAFHQACDPDALAGAKLLLRWQAEVAPPVTPNERRKCLIRERQVKVDERWSSIYRALIARPGNDAANRHCLSDRKPGGRAGDIGSST